MPKIRIKLRGFDHKSLDASAQKVVETAKRSGAEVAGPMPLPTRVRRFTVLRSPFKHKDSREHFELRTHNRLVDIAEKLGLSNRTQIAMYYAGQWQWLERYRNLLERLEATASWDELSSSTVFPNQRKTVWHSLLTELELVALASD